MARRQTSIFYSSRATDQQFRDSLDCAEDCSQRAVSLQDQLLEKELHVSRLLETLCSEREKFAELQCRCVQQEKELKRREQQNGRMREKLVQISDRHKHRGPSIEIVNVLSKRPGKRENTLKSMKASRRSEEALLLLLERREAELREAMKLRHGLTTLLHAMRNHMIQTLENNGVVDVENQTSVDLLLQTEEQLGDHVTGGVVLEWTRVQKKLEEFMSQRASATGTDQEKLLEAELKLLEVELEQSRKLIRDQQQLLQDGVSESLPSSLLDCCYLEEWERLQLQWLELKRQKKNFQRERQNFTDAAIRLGHERCEFQQLKASQLRSDFLCSSPGLSGSRWKCESTALGDLSVAAPVTPPSSERSRVAAWPLTEAAMTPNTPELYSALRLDYNGSRSSCKSSVSSVRAHRTNYRGSWGDAFEEEVCTQWPF